MLTFTTLFLQFCGNDSDTLVKAGLLAQNMCDAIDLNLGCPQAIAKRGHYGAFLQDEWDLLKKISKTIFKHCFLYGILNTCTCTLIYEMVVAVVVKIQPKMYACIFVIVFISICYKLRSSFNLHTKMLCVYFQSVNVTKPGVSQSQPRSECLLLLRRQ